MSYLLANSLGRAALIAISSFGLIFSQAISNDSVYVNGIDQGDKAMEEHTLVCQLFMSMGNPGNVTIAFKNVILLIPKRFKSVGNTDKFGFRQGTSLQKTV